jgi:hypothetical protein
MRECWNAGREDGVDFALWARDGHVWARKNLREPRAARMSANLRRPHSAFDFGLDNALSRWSLCIGIEVHSTTSYGRDRGQNRKGQSDIGSYFKSPGYHPTLFLHKIIKSPTDFAVWAMVVSLEISTPGTLPFIIY